MPLLLDYLRCVVGIVLLAAGTTKISDREKLTAIVRGYALLPESAVSRVARFLPFVECVVGILLLTHASTFYAAVAAALLFAVFAGAIAINLLRGRSNIACGCFGTHQLGPLQISHVVRNCVLAASAFMSAPTFWDQNLATLSVAEHLAVTVAAAVTVACWLLGELSIDLIRKTPMSAS